MFDLQLDAAVARLRLCRPDARNAIPAAQWSVLEAMVLGPDVRGARLLLIEGDEHAFCAGADLADFPALAGDPAACGDFRRRMRGALDAVAGLAIPTIALVQGACFGAGVALALACDFRIAGPEARFAITPARLGILYPQPDIARLVGLVGRQAASILLLGGGVIDAHDAQRIGLVTYAADPVVACASIVESILANDARSLEWLKRGIALAEAGSAEHTGQDAAFDRLLASSEPTARLKRLRLPARR